MNTRIRTNFTIGRLSYFLMALLMAAVLVSTQAPQAVSAWIDRDPDNPDDIVRPIDPPTFAPPADGFKWTMANRYGNDDNHDGMTDTFWNKDLQKYVENYIFPDYWMVYFSGCQTKEDFDSPLNTPNLYTWEVVGVEGLVANVHRCRAASLNFPAQGTYTVRLTVHDSSGNIVPAGKTNPEYFEQEITIRDILIVSMGDSYASGEGNPDIQQTYHPKDWPLPGWDLDTAAVWQDERCHRSAINGPSMAAMDLENSDPHTSITFISFACSGATINRLAWDQGLWFAPLGSGLLGHYWGAVNVGIPYSQTYQNYIPPQMDQLEAAMVPPPGKPARQIDSLIISAGGNDIHFGDILISCFFDDDCWADDNTIHDNPYNGTDYTLENIIQRDLGHWGASGPAATLPDSYSQLHGRINALQPAKPAHVYVTQYPDQTRDNNGDFCNLMEDVFVPNILDLKVNWMEARDAVNLALGPLNTHIREAVQAYGDDGWQFVDGLSVYDVDPKVPAGTPGLFVQGHDGKGHGYCASNNWIRRADEAELIQGPLNIRLLTRGQMHPNYGGHDAYKERLLRYMVPNLFGPQTQTPPEFSFSHSLNGYSDVVSADTGWLLESCTNDHQCQRKVVAQAVATSTVNLAGAQVSANGVDGCVIEGVTCLIPDSADPKRLTYDVEITASGIYQFQFVVQDSSGQVASLEQEIRVDLDGPVLATPIGPFDVQEGDSVNLVATASSPGENVFAYEWDLDNDGVFETIQTADEQPVFSAEALDGPGSQTIQVKVTDRAGWIDIEPATVNVLNVAPTVEINGAPVTSPEGTAINLTSSVTDPADDTFTYAWSVDKKGDNYASGTDSDFSFIPDDNGSYDVYLTATDDDGGAATTSVSIEILNVNPTPLILFAPLISPEGTTINLASLVKDPGTADTFTYAWTIEKNGSSYATGMNPKISFTPDDNGTYKASLKVTDKDGGAGTADSQTITVTNVAPALSNVKISSGMVSEGDSVTLSGNVSDPGAADTFELTIDWGDGIAPETISLAAGSTSFSRSHTYADDNPTATASDTNAIALSLADDDGSTAAGSSSVVVNNLAPTLSITAPAYGALYPLNTAVNLSAAIADTGKKDSFTLTVNWDDGTTTTGTVSAGVGSASHAFTAAGVYTIQANAADDDTGSDSETVMVVVYDPNAGFVTGGGWINSQAGAYVADPTLTGRANFGFVAKYQKGATKPTGETAFQFLIGGFEFYSSSYDWLVVSGARAQFKGTGAVNGVSGYSFLLTLTDGDINGGGGVDKFRIKIWDSSGLVYDNMIGYPEDMDGANPQAIGGGSIVIHNK